MKLHIPKDDLNNCGLPPLIFYKSGPTIGNNPEYKSDSLKVDIKTQPGKRDSETVDIHISMFRKVIL